MADPLIAPGDVICRGSALAERGDGVRFMVLIRERAQAAFAIRVDGRAHAYLNACAHLPMELDWNAGKFFDSEQAVLLCSTHGAAYDPSTGECRGGPCRGGALVRIAVVERDQHVYLEGMA